MPDVYSVEHGGMRRSSQYTDEIDTFLKLLRASGAKTAVEIGTFEGGTSVLLHDAMGEGSVVVGVDLEDPGLQADWFRFVKGNSTHYETIHGVDDALGGRPVDLLFIDAEHTEAAALADYEAYHPLLHDKSMTGFHDICMPQLWPMWNRLRGARACDRSVEIIRDVRQKCCGIGVLLGC